MTPEQLVAVLGAITALIVAVGAVYVQVLRTHQLVNGRMNELLEATRSSAHAEGVISAIAATEPAEESKPQRST